MEEAPSTCLLTQAAQSRVNASTCFSELQDLISYLPPSEQNLWANANKLNEDDSLCFKCDLVKFGLLDSVKKNIKSNTAILNKKAKDKRNAIGCFKALSEELEENEKKKISNVMEFVVSNQLEEGRCQAALLKDVGNILIQRKRILCASNIDRESMLYTKDNSKIEEFKFNINEANSLIDYFLNFFECQSNQLNTYASGISEIVNIVSNSSNCKIEEDETENLVEEGTMDESSNKEENDSGTNSEKETEAKTNSDTSTDPTIETNTDSKTDANTDNNTETNTETVNDLITDSSTDQSSNNTNNSETNILNNETGEARGGGTGRLLNSDLKKNDLPPVISKILRWLQKSNVSFRKRKPSYKSKPPDNKSSTSDGKSKNSDISKNQPETGDSIENQSTPKYKPTESKDKKDKSIEKSEKDSAKSDKSNKKHKNRINGGVNYISYLNEFSSLFPNDQSDNFNTILGKIKSSFDGISQVKCNPSAFNKFLSNIESENKIRDVIKSIKNSCTNDTFYIIRNGIIECNGSCDNFEGFEIKFHQETRVPKDYFLEFGCNSSKSFLYSEIPDLKYADVVFKTFRFNAESIDIDSNKECSKNSAKCVPGKYSESCSNIKDKCQKKLDEKCSALKLSEFILPTSQTYPIDCDYISKGVERDSLNFITSCLLYISKTFLKGTVTLNNDSLKNSNTIIAQSEISSDSESDIKDQSYPDSSHALRILENSNFITLEDATVTYDTFVDVILDSSDVQVDGSTSDSTASLDIAIKELLDDDSKSFIKISMGLILLIILF